MLTLSSSWPADKALSPLKTSLTCSTKELTKQTLLMLFLKLYRESPRKEIKQY